jgi:drug/metabolite transporter (DMT)-like permease
MFLSDLPMIHEMAALATALCWAITPLLSAWPASQLGAFAFNRLRQIAVAIALAVFVLASGRWQSADLPSVGLIVASGVLGVFAGDTLLFAALNRLGPRRNGVLFSLNAPMAAILGWMFLGEDLSPAAVAGIGVTIAGVMMAIAYGRNASQTHRLEEVKGPLWIGLGLGLCAALGQALGSIIARPVMQAGIDPFFASMLRVAAAACCLTVLMSLPIEAVKPRARLNLSLAIPTILSGLLAMGVGMTLLLFALSGGKTGIVATLSATSPVMILPLLWWQTGQRPPAGAWLGAMLVIAGMALIFHGP